MYGTCLLVLTFLTRGFTPIVSDRRNKTMAKGPKAPTWVSVSSGEMSQDLKGKPLAPPLPGSEGHTWGWTAARARQGSGTCH